MSSSSVDPIRILLVEDSPGDISLTLEALADARIANEVHIARDGEEAMAHLRETTSRPGAQPDLILLDLNLPRKDGREVLEEVKRDPELRTIPVVVLTTSAAEADILRSYQLNANAYVQKPVHFDDFLRAVRSIEDFWLSVVRLPRGSTP